MACAAIEPFSFPTQSAPPAEWQEVDLVNGILGGDERCFDELYARFHRRIYGFALKRLRDPGEAEDVTQEVFLQVHRCLASFQGRSSLLTWMFGIAHNQVCRRFRRKAPPTLSLDDFDAAELSAPDCPADRRVDAARVLKRCGEAVEAELSACQRQIFQLTYAENHSNRCVAEQLGKSRQAVKISLFRSRRTLAKHASGLDTLLAS
jgi:RNA polymerase sigma-70 factor (ECF subfamily)